METLALCEINLLFAKCFNAPPLLPNIGFKAGTGICDLVSIWMTMLIQRSVAELDFKEIAIMTDPGISELVTGLFAIAGVIVGSALTRLNEYEKWLRQQRTEAFATFVIELHDARLYASNVYAESTESELDKSIKVIEAFLRLEKYLARARLFISSTGRNNLSELVNELRARCTGTGGPGDHSIRNREIMDQIQTILEREINFMPWSFLNPSSWNIG